MGRRALVALSALAALCASACGAREIGSLDWTRRTGGALTGGEKAAYLLVGLPELVAAFARLPALPEAPKADLAALAPPSTPIVNEAIRALRETAEPPMANHSFRTAYWALVVMQREKGELAPAEIEEAWVAGLMHDYGLARPPEFGEFTLGGVAMIEKLAAELGWDPESARRAAEAVTLNPNSRVDREKYGLLPWAMNVGGYGETSWGPYRVLMHPENIAELERLYPRAGFHASVPRIVDAELARRPNQRFAILKAIGFVGRRLED